MTKYNLDEIKRACHSDDPSKIPALSATFYKGNGGWIDEELIPWLVGRIEELEAENKELHKMVDQGIDNFGDERRKNRELAEALRGIVEKDGMTMLSSCCVDKTCQAVHDNQGNVIAHCQHQWGVVKAYSECAGEAQVILRKHGLEGEG